MLSNNGFTKKQCKPCPLGSTADSVTKSIIVSRLLNEQHGKMYGDTVGLSDPNRTDLETATEQGIHPTAKSRSPCITIVEKYGRFTMAHRYNLQLISE